MYQLELKTPARKKIRWLKKKDAETYLRVTEALEELQENPYRRTVPVTRFEDSRRKAVGKYRIIFRVYPKEQKIVVALIRARDKAYNF